MLPTAKHQVTECYETFYPVTESKLTQIFINSRLCRSAILVVVGSPSPWHNANWATQLPKKCHRFSESMKFMIIL